MKLKQSLALLLCHISFILTALALVVLFGIEARPAHAADQAQATLPIIC